MRKFGLFFLLVLIPSLMMAQRADIVILRNGDKLTGEIRKLDRGMLEFKPDRMSVILIDWVRVVFLSTEYQFDLELESGERHIGTLEKAEDEGKLVVVSDGGRKVLDVLSVVRINPLAKKFWNRLRGYLDAGLSFQRAQEKLEWKLAGKATYRGEKWTMQTEVSSYFSRQKNVEGTTRNDGAVVYQRILNNRWTAVLLTTHEQNDELNLDYRALIGGTFGRFLVQNNRNFLVVSVGLTGTREKYSDSEDIGYNAEALLSIWYEAFKYSSPRLNFAAIFNVFPGITSWGRVRTNLSARLSFEVFRDFFFTLDGFHNFDSRPPGELAVKHDYGINTSISWSFN
jgi:hypothetical protein